MTDINNFPLRNGDIVDSLRYDLGRCRVIETGKGFVYESLATGEQVSWLRMVDAITGHQKVKKVIESLEAEH